MNRSDRSHLPVLAYTHPGMKGKNNEDRFAVSAFRLKRRKSTPVVWMIIADGVGGHMAGELAAEMAVEVISREVAVGDPSHPVETLKAAIQTAGSEIAARATDDVQVEGMSTTCVCAWVIGDRLYAAWVGDSRLYLLRQGMIIRLTTDHTWVQEAIEKGVIAPEQARNHPNAHVLRRHLGSQNGVEPDFRLQAFPESGKTRLEVNQGFRLRPGDQLLLCSDGLTDLVEDQEIQEHLLAKPLSSALPDLIDLANSRGGHDNITVIGMHVPDKPLKIPFLTLLAVLAFILLIALTWFGVNAWLEARITGKPTPTRTQIPLEQPVIIATGTHPILEPEMTPTASQQLTPVVTPTISIPSTVATSAQATYTPWPTSTDSGNQSLP